MAGRITTPVAARADDDGQRHRAHRGEFVHRLRHRQDLLPPDRRHQHGQRAGHRDLADDDSGRCRPGTTPPLILNYSASTVPILQLALSGKGLSEQALADLGMNQLRSRLVTVQGAAIPWPFGGKSRQVQIDLDSAALQARGLTGAGRRQRARRAEPDRAGRHAEDRQLRIHGEPQQRAVGSSPSLATCRSRASTARWSTVRDVAHVRDGSARAEPTSCTSTAAARC